MEKNKINKPERVSGKLVDDMKMASMERINRGLANPLRKNEISIREMTELLTRTNGYRNALEELKTKPKRRNSI